MNLNRRMVFMLAASGALLYLQPADGKPAISGTVSPDKPVTTTKSPDKRLSKPLPKAATRSVSTTVPSGYLQVGNTELFYRNSERHDFIGRLNGQYYGSTYRHNGYSLSIQVNNESARTINCDQATDINGVICLTRVEQQGELVRVVYTVDNTTDADAVVSLGTYADVMIGNNDDAPITRRIDTMGTTYGVTMKDNGAAQLCVLFGSGLAGVNGVDDFWFGRYGQNSSAWAMVGNYTAGNNWMEENGRYDSGMGWCWKNRTVPAGQAVEFSYLIGVGDVNLEPTSSFVATVDNPDLWNDLSLPHELTISGAYESPAGQNGHIEYAVEDAEEWLPLTGELTSGSEFSSTITVTFDNSRTNHVIRFRTIDNVGNASTLNPIVYRDVRYYELSGVKSLPYNFGEPVVQTDVTCHLSEEQYEITNYTNNINAGTASFDMVGVFPYTIGRRTYDFSINPRPLTGDVIVEGEYVYSGDTIYPTWHWSNEIYSNLIEGQDYTLSNASSHVGTHQILIRGIGNFTGWIDGHFIVEKAIPNEKCYNATTKDKTYDGKPNYGGLSLSVSGLCGTPTVSYIMRGDSLALPSNDIPSTPGTYDIYLSLTEGSCYKAIDNMHIGSMTIHPLDEEDCNAFIQLTRDLIGHGATLPWDGDVTPLDIPSLERVKLSGGNITGLDLSGCNISGEMPASLSGLKNLQSIDLSDNRLTGNMTPIAESLPALTSLNVSLNCFSDVYPSLPIRLTQRTIWPQTIDTIVEIDLATDNSESIIAKMPRIATYNNDATTTKPYLDVITLRLKTDDWMCDMTTWPDEWRLSAVDGKNVYHGLPGAEIEAEIRGRVSLKAKIDFPRGDANFNGSVDIADLQSIVNYILGAYSGKYLTSDYYYRWRYAPFNRTAANLWDDATVNIQDMVALTNILISATPSNRNRLRSLPGKDTADHLARVFCRDGYLFIDSTTPVAAFDIIISGTTDARLVDSLAEAGFTIASTTRDGMTHVIGYSMSEAEIPTGVIPVVHVGNDAKVSGATLSDLYAELIPCSTDIHTMTDGIIRDSEVSVRTDGAEISIVAPRQYGTCRWAIYTPDGKTLATGDTPLETGDNTIAIIDRRLVIVVLDTDGQRSVFKVATK